MPRWLLWGYHPHYVETMLARSRKALRHVDEVVKKRWKQTNKGEIPPGRGTADLAREAGLPGFTVEHVRLLENLSKEIFTAVNKAVLMEPLSSWDRWTVRRELRKAVKTAERSARDIAQSLGEPFP